MGVGTLVLLRHGESEWNAKNLFTGWVDVDLSAKGRDEAAPRRRAAARRRPAAGRRTHLGAAPRHHDGEPRPRRLRPALGAGEAALAAQRAPLRRPAGQGQGAGPRAVRRRAVHDLAPFLRHSAAAARRRQRVVAGRRRALRRRSPPRSSRAPSASRTSSTGCCPTGTTRSSPTCATARPCSSPPTATHCARW